MKKLFLSIALFCAATNIFAQTPELEALKKAGLEAVEAKNYQVAFDNLSSYLTQTNNQDSVMAFNCGIYADKLKKPADALKYFDIAVQKKYNLENAYIGKAGALKDLKRMDEYAATLKEGLTANPESKTLVKMYANYFVNQGVRAQKAKKMKEAEEAYKQAIEVQPKNLNALNALASLYYGQGAAKLKTDADAAKADFQEAKTYIEKLTPLLKESNPRQKKMLDNAKTMLNFINSQK